MAKSEWDDLVESYLTWLRAGISIETVGDLGEITTPFLDRHNDHLQIYVRRLPKGRFELTDGGETIADLAASGLDVKQRRRRETVDVVLRGFGVRNEQGHLIVDASASNLGQKTHALVQAMLAVNDMYVLARSRVASYFWDDVREFLDENDVRYSARLKLSGKSGYDHAVDFLIPRSKEQPERLVQAIANPSKAVVSNYLFAIADARALRSEPLAAYALLNDRAREVSTDTLEALDAYDVRPTLWSQRTEVIAELAA